jgi:hypothetical protein
MDAAKVDRLVESIAPFATPPLAPDIAPCSGVFLSGATGRPVYHQPAGHSAGAWERVSRWEGVFARLCGLAVPSVTLQSTRGPVCGERGATQKIPAS